MRVNLGDDIAPPPTSVEDLSKVKLEFSGLTWVRVSHRRQVSNRRLILDLRVFEFSLDPDYVRRTHAAVDVESPDD